MHYQAIDRVSAKGQNGSSAILSPEPRSPELNDIRRLHRACPVCAMDTGFVLGRLSYALLGNSWLANEYDIVACTGCGYVSCDTPTKDHEFERFYADYCYSPAYIAHDLLPEEDRYYTQIVECVAPYLSDERPAIFDIGCGTGSFLRKCQAVGYGDLFAVDLSSSCIARLASFGFRAALGSAARVPFEEVAPGAIILSHVVEHLANMKESLAGVRQRLESGGIVYVEVPDAERYEQYRPGNPLQFLYLQHVVHFDRTHLDNVFAANGFAKLDGGTRVRDENGLLTPALWSVYECRPSNRDPIAPDFRLAHTMQTWFATNRLDPDGAFTELAQSGRRVYVWGVSIHVQMMLGMSPLRDCNVACCVDQDPKLHNQMIGRLSISPPSVLHQATAHDTVVIGSLVHRRAMEQHLREEIGFCGQVLTFSADSEEPELEKLIG